MNSGEPCWFFVPRQRENSSPVVPGKHRENRPVLFRVALEAGKDEILLNSDVTRTQDMPLIFYCTL